MSQSEKLVKGSEGTSAIQLRGGFRTVLVAIDLSPEFRSEHSNFPAFLLKSCVGASPFISLAFPTNLSDLAYSQRYRAIELTGIINTRTVKTDTFRT